MLDVHWMSISMDSELFWIILRSCKQSHRAATHDRFLARTMAQAEILGLTSCLLKSHMIYLYDTRVLVHGSELHDSVSCAVITGTRAETPDDSCG